MADVNETQALALGRALLQALGGNMATKAVGTPPNASYLHGLGGLFATPALERPVFSAMLLPQAGLQSQLPIVSSEFDYPNYAILTGQTASSPTTEPSAACGTYPEIGNLKRCVQQMPFGRYGRSTQIIDITRVGRVRDRGETVDLQLIGDPFSRPGVGTNVPTLPGVQGSGNVLNDEIAGQMFKLGVGLVRDFAKNIYTSSPDSNPSADPQSMTKYFNGLQKLVNTGYKDAQAGSLCPAADSLVRNFANQNISVSGPAGPAIVKELVYQSRYLRRKAEMIGYGEGVVWKFVVRPAMFYELTAVWPCSYYTNRCTTTDTANTTFVDAKGLTDMRDEMRVGNFLWIDGKKIPVILDESLPEAEIGNGVFFSDIYLLPFTVDSIPTLYLEYYKYDTAIAAARNVYGPNANLYFDISDNGRFLITKLVPTGTCVQFQAQTETRLILRTPFLASRTINTRYSPLIHEAEPFTDSGYYQNGGITTTQGLNPYFYPAT